MFDDWLHRDFVMFASHGLQIALAHVFALEHVNFSRRRWHVLEAEFAVGVRVDATIEHAGAVPSVDGQRHAWNWLAVWINDAAGDGLALFQYEIRSGRSVDGRVYLLHRGCEAVVDDVDQRGARFNGGESVSTVGIGQRVGIDPVT